MELVVVIVILGFTGIGEILILDIIYEIDFFKYVSMFLVLHMSFLLPVFCLVIHWTLYWSFHKRFLFYLDDQKPDKKRSNHKNFGASKTNRVCWGFFFNFLTLTVGDRQKYFKIMQFKKIYKTETRNVVYLVIFQILVLDLLNNFIDNEHKVSRKYVNLFRTIDLFNV